MTRGKIRNRAYAGQVRDYSGLAWGKITPSDVDMFLDFESRLFVWVELKHNSKRLQGSALSGQERACRAAVEKLNAPAALIMAQHATPAAEDIDVARAPVLDLCVNQHLFSNELVRRIGRDKALTGPAGGELRKIDRVGRSVRQVIDILRLAVGLKG
jgi:hypothetical protein